MTKWGEELTCKFVNEYKNHECLWNPKCEDYKNRDARNAAYAAIMHAMNLTDFGIADVKNKIKNLRSTYSQEIKKIKYSKKSINGTETTYKPTIKWFEDMKEMIDGDYPANFRDSLETNQGSHFHKMEEDMSDEDPLESNNYPELVETTTTDLNKSADRKRKRSDNIYKITNALKQLRDMSSKAEDVPLEDEFYFFGMNVAAQLRNLPLDRALHTQVQIQNMLAEERISLSYGTG